MIALDDGLPKSGRVTAAEGDGIVARFRNASVACAAFIVTFVADVGLVGQTIDVGRGPIPVVVPSSYDPGTPTPLVIMLHGYSSSGAAKEAEWQITPLAEEYGFLYLYPDGTQDFLGNRFWNATDACCNLFGSNVDDVGYLMDLVDAMKAQYNVDPRRVFFTGHSNGAFMCHRMACEDSEDIAAIASVSGATFLDPLDCTPAEPVNVLQVHGTSDTVISYDGGCVPFGGCYPSAVETVADWTAYNGCSPVGDTSPPPLDMVANITGNETSVTRYATDCDAGGSAELWTMAGAGHSPAISQDFSRNIVEFLLSHPKPVPQTPGDMDCNALLDIDDVGPFALALTDPAAYAGLYGCAENGDLNRDMSVDGADIGLFVVLLVGP